MSPMPAVCITCQNRTRSPVCKPKSPACTRPPSHARIVSQATGVLIERHKVTADEAMALLRRASQVCGRKLVDVASELLYTGKLVDGFPQQRPAERP